jgi:phenylalanine-4-hydroxylase
LVLPVKNLVELNPDHPGFADPTYRARRDAIARLALEWARTESGPIPVAPYTDEEHRVWREVWAELAPLHQQRVARELLDLQREFPIDRAAIPQLAEVSDRLEPRTGFRMVPVEGLVAPRRFFSLLGDGVFNATQYVRHPSRPLYTPEPDVIHELAGHAATLAHPRLAAINRKFGEAAAIGDRRVLVRIERVYWFTLEFGVCSEDGEIKAVGAGLLSSVGELARGTDRATAGLEFREFDLEAIAACEYDTSNYQRELFVARSFTAMLDELDRWLDIEIRGE